MVMLDNVQHSLHFLFCQLCDSGIQACDTKNWFLRVYELPEKITQKMGRGGIAESLWDQMIKMVYPCTMAIHTIDQGWTQSNLSSPEAGCNASCASLILYSPASSNGSQLALTLTSMVDATKCHFHFLGKLGTLAVGCVIVMSGLVAWSELPSARNVMVAVLANTGFQFLGNKFISWLWEHTCGNC